MLEEMRFGEFSPKHSSYCKQLSGSHNEGVKESGSPMKGHNKRHKCRRKVQYWKGTVQRNEQIERGA